MIRRLALPVLALAALAACEAPQPVVVEDVTLPPPTPLEAPQPEPGPTRGPAPEIEASAGAARVASGGSWQPRASGFDYVANDRVELSVGCSPQGQVDIYRAGSADGSTRVDVTPGRGGPISLQGSGELLGVNASVPENEVGRFRGAREVTVALPDTATPPVTTSLPRNVRRAITNCEPRPEPVTSAPEPSGDGIPDIEVDGAT